MRPFCRRGDYDEKLVPIGLWIRWLDGLSAGNDITSNLAYGQSDVEDLKSACRDQFGSIVAMVEGFLEQNISPESSNDRMTQRCWELLRLLQNGFRRCVHPKYIVSEIAACVVFSTEVNNSVVVDILCGRSSRPYAAMNFAMRQSRQVGRSDWNGEVKMRWTSMLHLFKPLMVRLETLLERLDPVECTVYRALDTDIDPRSQEVNALWVWHSFASTSLDIGTAVRFLGTATFSPNIKKGTLIIAYAQSGDESIFCQLRATNGKFYFHQCAHLKSFPSSHRQFCT